MPITSRLRLLAAMVLVAAPFALRAQTRAVQAPDPRRAPTAKPPLHAKHWLAITGKPLSADPLMRHLKSKLGAVYGI